MFSHKPYPTPAFVIEHKRLDERAAHFLPLARIHLTDAARSSGFLRKLSGLESRLLLALMAHITANGEVSVTSWQVAKTLGVPTPVIAVNLFRLTHRRFGGYPLLQRHKTETGLAQYRLSHQHVKHQIHPPMPEKAQVVSAAGREAVYDYVRKEYALPRSVAEQTVMQQLGLHPEEINETRLAHVYRELRYLKFKHSDSEALVAVFGMETLEKHIAWLPERTTRPDAKSLVKALINEYGRPQRLQDVLDRYLQKKEREARRTTEDRYYPDEEGGDD